MSRIAPTGPFLVRHAQCGSVTGQGHKKLIHQFFGTSRPVKNRVTGQGHKRDQPVGRHKLDTRNQSGDKSTSWTQETHPPVFWYVTPSENRVTGQGHKRDQPAGRHKLDTRNQSGDKSTSWTQETDPPVFWYVTPSEKPRHWARTQEGSTSWAAKIGHKKPVGRQINQLDTRNSSTSFLVRHAQ